MIESVILIALSVFAFISVYNLFTAPQLIVSSKTINNQKLISVLIPARNEENNISNIIVSVLAQTYPNIEVLILDDNSEDNTYRIASNYQSEIVKVYKGKKLPDGWLGKNWACHQLAEKANGDYLLFIDADVKLNSGALEAAINELEQNSLSLVSVFPTQKIQSIGENLIVPLMNWLLLAFLPLKLVYSSASSSFVAANGQFMMWKKEDYLKIGGHQKVKDKIVEDMELARLAKRNQLKIKTLLGKDLVVCRMYNSFNAAYKGFQKNFYAGFSINPILFFLMITSLTTIFTSPICLGLSISGIIALVLIFIIRFNISVISKQNIFVNFILHPFQMIFMFLIGTLSVIKYKTNKLEWKSRRL